MNSQSLNNRAEELKHPHARIAALGKLEARLQLLLAKTTETKEVLKAKQDAPLPNGVRPGERIMRVEHVLNANCATAEFELDRIVDEVMRDPNKATGTSICPHPPIVTTEEGW